MDTDTYFSSCARILKQELCVTAGTLFTGYITDYTSRIATVLISSIDFPFIGTCTCIMAQTNFYKGSCLQLSHAQAVSARMIFKQTTWYDFLIVCCNDYICHVKVWFYILVVSFVHNCMQENTIISISISISLSVIVGYCPVDWSSLSEVTSSIL